VRCVLNDVSILPGVVLFSIAGGLNKNGVDSTYCTEALGGAATIREPTPRRGHSTYCLVAVKFPRFQYETQSECFK